jgi:hypothetical protein
MRKNEETAMKTDDNKVRREHLTDTQWAAVCNLFEVIRRAKATLKDKREVACAA